MGLKGDRLNITVLDQSILLKQEHSYKMFEFKGALLHVDAKQT